jgi:hypothetical protein
MKTNEIPCYFETDDSFLQATGHVNIAYIESLNSLCVGVDVIAGDERHTVYIPHESVPQLVQGLSSSYFSIQESIEQMEEDDAKQ